MTCPRTHALSLAEPGLEAVRTVPACCQLRGAPSGCPQPTACPWHIYGQRHLGGLVTTDREALGRGPGLGTGHSARHRPHLLLC